MLRKLLKYDLKWIYKSLIVFYILAIVFALFGRIFSEIENSFIFFIMGKIFNGATIAMIVNIIINSLIRIWVRFIRNIYKDESYLTHTLPLKKQTIFLSKILSGIITMFTSALVIFACIAICYYSEANLQFLKQSLELVAIQYDSTIISFLLVIGLVMFLELVFALFSGILGIILGYKSNNNKTLKSIIYGFLLYMVQSIVTMGVIFIMGLFNPEIMKLFSEVEGFEPGVLKAILYAGIFIYSVYIVIYYIIGNIQFKKGVNVD